MDDGRPGSYDSSPDSGDETAICHVFAADPQLHLHSFHYYYAKKFGIRCRLVFYCFFWNFFKLRHFQSVFTYL